MQLVVEVDVRQLIPKRTVKQNGKRKVAEVRPVTFSLAASADLVAEVMSAVLKMR